MKVSAPLSSIAFFELAWDNYIGSFYWVWLITGLKWTGLTKTSEISLLEMKLSTSSWQKQSSPTVLGFWYAPCPHPGLTSCNWPWVNGFSRTRLVRALDQVSRVEWRKYLYASPLHMQTIYITNLCTNLEWKAPSTYTAYCQCKWSKAERGLGMTLG